ncbi:ABC transporter permease [Allobacillus sp. SKP2-8]|uniref:ABC transporter permease n=1 Tax=unclassified Allobacillus TaxID=2628859 RepID=UPI001181C8CD|nr:ABC transporter permease [Allobacillus sp. SKP2-8]TSJ62532.1 ABC transporter permease [Allobacillus sp. SKP2-8]
MKSAIMVLTEQVKNFHLIKRLSLYELKSKNKSNYLGMAWEVINPTIQILIYWFVFGTLREREPVMVGDQEVPFFMWLLAAFFLWIFFYQSTIEGSKAIYSRLKMLSKMNFPMSVIPNYIIFSKLYVHIFMLVLSVIIFQLAGFYINIYYLQLFYFLFCILALVFSLSLITSTLSTIIRDVHMLLNSTLRMLLYLSAVLWPLTELSEFPILADLLQLNPLIYIIEGYRSAFFGVEWYFITQWEYTLYFWGLVFILFGLGSAMHVKFRKYFIDFL